MSLQIATIITLTQSEVGWLEVHTLDPVQYRQLAIARPDHSPRGQFVCRLRLHVHT